MKVRTQAYDPAFNSVDVAVLQELGVEVLSADEARNHVSAEPTLFYMPHCGGSLYEEVVCAHEQAGTLESVLILGNNLLRVVEGNRTRRCKLAAVLRECPAQVWELPGEGYEVLGAFNDVDLHSFGE